MSKSAYSEYANELKAKLTSLITNLVASPEARQKHLKNPLKDFTRNRKLSFETVVEFIIAMGEVSIPSELHEALGWELDAPSPSALAQQREKITSCAFEDLFHDFTASCPLDKTFQGYRLWAADGSEVNILPTTEDDGTYVNNHANGAGYYAMHLNVIYDLLSKVYIDAFIQPGKKMNETKAVANMLDRSTQTDKVILIADRGYESHNLFAHCEETGWKYLIRVKDVNSRGILSRLSLPQTEEFDIPIHRIITRKKTKETKSNPQLYYVLNSNAVFDYLPCSAQKGCEEYDLDQSEDATNDQSEDATNDQSEAYPLSFRAVRFKIEDELYETVITNLDANQFPPEALKELYRMRWGVETSFRKLKHDVNLESLHSRKRDRILQEIYAKLIMYNFVEMVISQVDIPQVKGRATYQADFSNAIKVCRKLFCVLKENAPLCVADLILRRVSPVRPNRCYERTKRSNGRARSRSKAA